MKNMIMACLVIAASVATGANAEEVPPFTVDFTKEVGAVKLLNGVCNATPLSGARTKSINDKVLKLEIPYYRFHDASLENPGIQLIDIQRIFPLLNADADDPANYRFKPTDDYLKQVIDAGAKIEFRLGESIEHSKNTYLVNDPVDYEKWADVCCHIIRHYNEGWADGFKWNIERWSIWEEPDTNPNLLTGKPNPFTSIYLPLYAAASRRIKKEFPSLKVGGPQGCGTWHTKEFIEYCAKNKLPLDFYGFTRYARDPDDFADLARTIRECLDKNGYKDTEISLAEWHWGPTSWVAWGTVTTPLMSKAYREELTGCDSTAFTAATLIRMQDSAVDYMYYYAMKCGEWGLFDADKVPYGSYYSMLAFAQLAHGKTRVAAPIKPSDRFYMLASKDPSAKRGYILAAALRTDGAFGPLTLKGCKKPLSVRVVDPVHDLAEVEGWKWDAEKGVLSVPRLFGDSNVWLVEVETE